MGGDERGWDGWMTDWNSELIFHTYLIWDFHFSNGRIRWSYTSFCRTLILIFGGCARKLLMIRIRSMYCSMEKPVSSLIVFLDIRQKFGLIDWLRAVQSCHVRRRAVQSRGRRTLWPRGIRLRSWRYVICMHITCGTSVTDHLKWLIKLFLEMQAKLKFTIYFSITIQN